MPFKYLECIPQSYAIHTIPAGTTKALTIFGLIIFPLMCSTCHNKLQHASHRASSMSTLGTWCCKHPISFLKPSIYVFTQGPPQLPLKHSSSPQLPIRSSLNSPLSWVWSRVDILSPFLVPALRIPWIPPFLVSPFSCNARSRIMGFLRVSAWPSNMTQCLNVQFICWLPWSRSCSPQLLPRHTRAAQHVLIKSLHYRPAWTAWVRHQQELV